MDTEEIYEKIQTLVQKEIATAQEKNEQDLRFNVADIPAHEHTGVDSSKINHDNIEQRRLYLPINLYGADPATAANYGVFFIAPFVCNLTSVRVAFQVASTSGTLQIEKLERTQILDAGTALLVSALSLSGTANTVASGSLVLTSPSLQLAVGDRLALKDAGTLTNLVGLCVIIEITY